MDDAIFVDHIKKKLDNYEDGKDVTPDSLTIAALNKYQTLVNKGKWRVDSSKKQ